MKEREETLQKKELQLNQMQKELSMKLENQEKKEDALRNDEVEIVLVIILILKTSLLLLLLLSLLLLLLSLLLLLRALTIVLQFHLCIIWFNKSTQLCG